MKQTGSKLLKLGLGALLLTKEKIESTVDLLVQKGGLGKTDAKALIDRLSKKGEQAQKDLNRNLEKMIEQLLKRLKIPTQKDIENLKAEIDKLKKK